MAKKTKPQAEPQVEQAAAVAATEPQQSVKLIVVKPTTTGRWYVYFKGIKPEDNVGCSCKTPQKALNYMHLLRRRHEGAALCPEAVETLKAEIAKGA